MSTDLNSNAAHEIARHVTRRHPWSIRRRCWHGAGRSTDLPAPVHPDPLLRMAKQYRFESRVVAPAVLPNGFAGVFALDEWRRFLETQYVRDV
jgi:hypothetical protein